ncbi:hypothetical protein [Methanogenium cariaci]|uniref:hypothetical protein n=1 Tax=Methanogenium cariaci TaxID=2197 RepID=UPI000A94992F|nr:hypothetical protein [Methanogenium cariaci]
MVFDTETTIDLYQNLKIGYFQIYQDDILQHHGLIYNAAHLDNRERKTLKRYAEQNSIELYSQKEFIDEVFYREVFDLKTSVLGSTSRLTSVGLLTRQLTHADETKEGSPSPFLKTVCNHPLL